VQIKDIFIVLALFHPLMRIICKPTPVGITLELEISPSYVHPEKFLLNFLPGPSWPPSPVKNGTMLPEEWSTVD
jgi:hypothetical protein